MIAPAAPPITAPMIAPLAVDPVWLPIIPPIAAPAPAPIAAPSSFLPRLAHALAPTEPTTRSAVRTRRCRALDIFMFTKLTLRDETDSSIRVPPLDGYPSANPR